MAHQHFVGITHRRQVVDLVPLLQQRKKIDELGVLLFTQIQPELLRTISQLFQQGRLTHAAASTEICPDRLMKSLKPPFFRCTSSNEMAAGVTPDMRDA
ncbi:hypothetical protein SDC9_95286 [bioreactor metagenome]|uniref:Uncharacterized protein n=1 Tax=bioreactor metagenome TaxID=1076179 RepID=A0A645A8F0_9ZZZZ